MAKQVGRCPSLIFRCPLRVFGQHSADSSIEFFGNPVPEPDPDNYTFGILQQNLGNVPLVGPGCSAKQDRKELCFSSQ